jgi:hypothetical protein
LGEQRCVDLYAYDGEMVGNTLYLFKRGDVLHTGGHGVFACTTTAEDRRRYQYGDGHYCNCQSFFAFAIH